MSYATKLPSPWNANTTPRPLAASVSAASVAGGAAARPFGAKDAVAAAAPGVVQRKFVALAEVAAKSAERVEGGAMEGA